MTTDRAPRPISETSPRRAARRSAAALSCCALLLAPLLTGCFNGPGATTTMQSTMNSGNGTQAQVGSIKIDNATLVTGPDGTTSGTLILSLFNVGNEPDTLVGVSINGKPAVISGKASVGSGVELAPGAALTFGYQDSTSWMNSYDLTGAESSYVPVEMQFQRAGIASFTVLTVPAVGYYEGIAPNPATRPLS